MKFLTVVVEWSLRNRPLVLVATVLFVLFGIRSATTLSVDAVPDITNVQVQIITAAPALSPVEVEQYVTVPVERAMAGVPRSTQIRSISKYGLSVVTIVFTDLVGFSKWSLSVGDEITLRLLRRVAQVFEPPLLESGGHIVKRMGDGSMAVFSNPVTALRSVIRALDALKEVEIDGYHPKMRAGIHTGRPQRIGSDLLGVDVNIAARVMERATKGGLIISQATLDRIDEQYLDALGVTPKKVRKQLFAAKASGVPEDLAMYWIRPRKDAATEPDDGELAEA